MTSSSVRIDEAWVAIPHGRLFARCWTPPAMEGQARPVDRTPIVLFHDSLGCVDLWRDFPAALALRTGRKVLAYDRWGFGRSEVRPGRLALDFVADEARSFFPAVRSHWGLERFIAFGHSVGGGMAVHCAAAFAADCVALVTESAQSMVEERTLQGIREAKALFQDEGQVERLCKYHGDKARWVLDAWTETWLDPQFASWSLAAVLPGVRCPLLAIHGAQDEYGSTAQPQMIADLSAGPSQLAIIEATAHVPHRERADAVLDLVARFLAPIE
ncbi:MAG: alpha/beta fold hydrolase [Comamonas sp.]